MEISSTDSKVLIAEAKAVAKSGDSGSKSDEFAATLATLLGKTGSRMSEGSSHGLQSSSKDALEDGNLGSGKGQEMATARQSVHGDKDDAPANNNDDRPVATAHENRNDYDDNAPAGNNDGYHSRTDENQQSSHHNDRPSDNNHKEPSNTSHSADAHHNNGEQGSDRAHNNADGAAHANGQTKSGGAAAGIAGQIQAALAGGVGQVLTKGDKPIIAVTTQLQSAMAAGENTKGNNQSGQATGKENATDGLNQALNALGKETGSVKNAEGENVAGDAAKKGAKGATAAKVDVKATAQSQIAGGATNIEAKVAENMPREVAQNGRAAEAATAKATQAAAIAKAIGADANLSVEVNVENTAETLVSRPRSSLSSTGIGDGAKGQPQNQAQGVNANGAQAMMQTGQQITGQAQAQLGANNAAKMAAQQGPAIQGVTSATSSAGAGFSAAITGGGEGISNLSHNQNTQQTANTQKPEPPAPSHRNVMEQVTVQITKAVNSGADKIDIQLRPASLGRVDVRLEMTGDGRISATIIADNRDTLDMLQRGARDLTQALNNAGLQTDSQNLNFSLREQANQHAGNGGSGKDEKLDFSEVDDKSAGQNDIDDPVALEAALRRVISEGRIDIRA